MTSLRRAAADHRPGDGGAPPMKSRLFRLHAFEVLIFVVMFILFALCIATAPIVAYDIKRSEQSERSGQSGQGGRRGP